MSFKVFQMCGRKGNEKLLLLCVQIKDKCQSLIYIFSQINLSNKQISNRKYLMRVRMWYPHCTHTHTICDEKLKNVNKTCIIYNYYTYSKIPYPCSMFHVRYLCSVKLLSIFIWVFPTSTRSN